jgi:ubiquinone/menaquinone biosynthesis C-methylase UbiE
MSRGVFDAWAPAYDASALQPAYRAAHAAVLREAHRLISRPRRVLDVGCGTGQLLRTAADTFPGTTLVGVDKSGVMLSRAGAAGSTTPWFVRVQASAESLPFADHTFDLVVSTASFRHWNDQRIAMREIHRVLAPGGLLGLAELYGSRRRGLLSHLVGRRSLPPTYETPLRAAGLHPIGVSLVDGFGPITALTVVLARRPAGRGGGRHQ